ncbi:hypothetical protein R3P38DRAFT_2543093 [Favolaschia claudopus]|uniref:Fork-head domain-containing protein n=1 Tax=Favolaschia claudopus TaxID=2862362 RepID=A0AAW0AV29_9AGAR
MSAVHQSLSTNYVDAGHYLRQAWTPPLPSDFVVDLWCLPDPGVKPSQSLILLAKLAIYGSTRGMLTLQGIINALQNRFLFFRQNPGEPWARSIRHILSLKAMFVKLEQSPSRRGAVWTLDITKGEGDKRQRRRRIHANHPSPRKADHTVSNESRRIPNFRSSYFFVSFGSAIPLPVYGGRLEPNSTL